MFSLLVGLWKILNWFKDKSDKKQERKEEGYNAFTEAKKKKDVSAIVAATNDVNNA